MELPGKEGIERIRRMEQAFDRALDALACGRKDEVFWESIRLLEEYVSGGQWLRDYEMDEQGLWPGDLKRGVLSQDALYDLFTRNGQKGERV